MKMVIICALREITVMAGALTICSPKVIFLEHE